MPARRLTTRSEKPAAAGARNTDRHRPSARVPAWLRPDPIHVLGLVLLAAAVTRGHRLRTPSTTVIFDEHFYVNAARTILGLDVPAGAPYADQPAGLDPNLEHPPLGKLLIAGSMHLFGDNGFGWRLPSLLAGIASIVLVYAIVRAVSPDGWLAVLAATIFAFDSLVLVHSRIATLDMPFVAFLLLGVWCWLRGWPLAAGVACAVAALVKLPAVLGLGALLLLGVAAVVRQRLRERTWNAHALRGTALLLLGFVSVWFGGLWLLDVTFTQYNAPWTHLRFMLDYGFSITSRGESATRDSEPWRWLVNEVQMPYFRVNEDAGGGGDPSIYFRGAMNPVVIFAAPLAVSYVAWRAWRFRDKLSLWVLAWIAATYVAFYPLVLLTQRTTYIFYILLALPAVAVAIAQLLREPRLPRVVTWAYLLAVAVGFVLYYPFRHVL